MTNEFKEMTNEQLSNYRKMLAECIGLENRAECQMRLLGILKEVDEEIEGRK